MYEHVICINPLNLTLRSSTPDFFTRLGFEGTLTSEFARSQGGRRGSDPVLHQSYGLETSLISLSSLLGRNAPKKAKKQFSQLVILWRHKPDYQYNLSPFKTGETLLTLSCISTYSRPKMHGHGNWYAECHDRMQNVTHIMLVIYEADYTSIHHVSIQQLGKHCISTACYQATSTHHIIPADKKVYIAT